MKNNGKQKRIINAKTIQPPCEILDCVIGNSRDAQYGH